MTPSIAAGYSGTPLAKKLGIKQGSQVLLVGAPDDYESLRTDVPAWVSWPKKSAKVPTDITEDTIRAVALPLGFVDIKVCAVSEVWSGLKLVVRKELR